MPGMNGFVICLELICFLNAITTPYGSSADPTTPRLTTTAGTTTPTETSTTTSTTTTTTTSTATVANPGN